ncbi:carbonic anhydrase 6 isoform X2 [Helicoverpa armigera]|uniref:carbonic anhydrase 6 isoform X2 n=1 Tax=Helicoverpa armigera TaxID=29058 RepID=UPI0021113712|nr:carbonic anhydrase 6 isoform X2 [Helicoverpa armigera]
MYLERIPKITLCCLMFMHIQASGYTAQSQDQTSSRTNTLFDDADDIQRQLDNEARDRIKYGRPKTIWRVRKSNKREEEDDVMTPPLPPFRDWDYNDQAKWPLQFPECGGKSQSPVDLPIAGLIKSRGARALLFQNYDVQAKALTLMNDGKRVILFGEWRIDQRPLIYGGAAHSRRYLFHHLTLHLPAEHTVGGLQYPLETQAFYVSAEYQNMGQALDASPSDPQAFLAVSNLYKYANHTHKGLEDLLASAKQVGWRNGTLCGKSLSFFNPPFKEYACYQGSMTAPPCTESVLWLIRGRTLSVTRSTVEEAQTLLISETEPKHLFFRSTQPLNDRKVYLFK